MNFLITIASVGFPLIVGYLLGAARAFREAKQKAYQEILAPIIKMAYRSQEANEGEFCEALSKLWLYGSKNVTKKMDDALSIAHDPRRGNISTALQAAIAEMRKDIQINPLQKLKPEQVNHIFTRIQKTNNDSRHSEHSREL